MKLLNEKILLQLKVTWELDFKLDRKLIFFEYANIFLIICQFSFGCFSDDTILVAFLKTPSEFK